ncbi:flagellar hook-basal body complex protein [Roseivivax isoporae]|uniref:Flagellar basal-body rod protein FlgF n=1 Tax=Roseivivax isoporae LMG 25204 TaxID=1449351 RepID=X7FC69_9RHOB|nr:flagellar hook-basal body complex protein [Roseivivax isoporae]ETX29691.1 flagellar basal body rod protein FlgF [Roseivivax isoporae LMG 25204]
MQVPGYTTLTRLSGLMREMQVVANNIANAETTGYRQQGVLFSEYVARLGDGSVSMAAGRIGQTDLSQGTLKRTGGQFDLAIEGDGFFQVQGPDGVRLTRAGAFSPGPAGELLTMTGHVVLDAGGAPILVPPGAGDLAIAEDGTMSSAGRPVGQIGLVVPLDPRGLVREGDTLFRADAGVDPVTEPRLRQGFLESSNVDTLGQIARMVEVQRAYELGQSFLDQEHERVKAALLALSR